MSRGPLAKYAMLNKPNENEDLLKINNFTKVLNCLKEYETICLTFWRPLSTCCRIAFNHLYIVIVHD